MCDRCDELEEEVAYLKSELGLQESSVDIDRVRVALRLTPHEALALLMLYRASPRVVTGPQLLDAMPPREGGAEDDRLLQCVSVRICKIRKKLGREAIDSAWGRGYRLTPVGVDMVGLALGVERHVSGPELRDLSERPPEELRSLVAHLAGILAHRDGDGGVKTAATFRRIADRLTGQPRVAA